MRGRLAAILFVIILAFITVFSVEVFGKLFIDVDNKFSETASGAFFGAFLAFVFVRLGDFFKSYSDRVTKGYCMLVKLEYTLNNLLSELDDNVYIISVFEDNYKEYSEGNLQCNIFVWGNRLSEVTLIGDLTLELLNIDLINELFVLDIHLRKLNDSMNTLNFVYVESKDALLGKNIDVANYKHNLSNMSNQLVDIKKFLINDIEETKRALSAIRVLLKNRPIMSYVFKILASNKYGNKFETLRLVELNELNIELSDGQGKGKERIDNVMNNRK